MNSFFDSTGLNVHAKVLKVEIVADKQRPNGNRQILKEATIGDETGIIQLTLRTPEHQQLVQPNMTITIRNAKIEMFRNHMRVAVDKWGLIEKAAQPITGNINESNNLSATEYELVNLD